MDKTFCGWLWAIANVATALKSINGDCADQVVEASVLGLENVDPNEPQQRFVAVGMTFHDVLGKGMMAELHMEEFTRLPERPFRLATGDQQACCEAAAPGLHQTLAWELGRQTAHFLGCFGRGSLEGWAGM